MNARAARAAGAARSGFTVLECMIALLLIATALIIVAESQGFATDGLLRAARLNTASMLARDIMTELEMRMAKEGFGEIEVHERGDFSDERYANDFEGYRWEYEVETVEFEMPNLSSLLGMAEEGSDALGAAGGGNELAQLDSMGIDLSMFGEMMGNYLREARVRICWEDGPDGGQQTEDCIEVTSQLTNPTGRVLTADEQAALQAQGIDTEDVGSSR